METVLQEIEIQRPHRPPVTADLRTSAPGGERPVIIVCHGFLGYKRWGFFPYLSERLAEAGFHVLTMSFSMNGVDERTGLITRPLEFARNTVSTEMEDLRAACRFVRAGALAREMRSNGAWGLMGHSRGAAIAILVARECPEARALVTWSTLGTLDRYTARRKREWRRTGTLRFTDARSAEPLGLDYAYYEDIESHRDEFDLAKAAGSLRVPHLMVHGDRDGAATLREAERLAHEARGASMRLEVIRGAGHTFNVRHPMRRPTAALEAAVKLTTGWFARALAPVGKECS